MREKKTCLHEEWGQMSTSQLDDILQAELQKEHPDENTVLPILEILEDREGRDTTAPTEAARAAWEKFKKNTAKPKQRRSPIKWITSIAAVVVIVCAVLLAVPLEAEADTLLDRLMYLTDRVLQFFDPDSDPGDLQREYIFETDNPGLQQLYDKMLELGVTEPVVPMWLPDGYALVELRVTPMRDFTKVYANLANREDSIMMQYKLVTAATTTQYEVKDKQVEVYESFGVYHTITKNEKELSIVWEKSGIECIIAGDLERKDLYAIIDSIYRRVPQ